MAMGLTQNEKLILSSIDELRKKRSKRPDKESVSFHVSNKHGLGMEEALETIDSLIEDKVIEIRKTDKGKESFYVSNSINDAVHTISEKQVFEKLECEAVTERLNGSVIGNASADVRSRNLSSPSHEQNHPKALKGDELSHAICQMAATINNLNEFLQIEKSKSENLLRENFELKLRNKDLENEIQRIHYSPNNRTSSSESKAFEIRTDLVTGAKLTSSSTNSNNNNTAPQVKTLPNTKLNQQTNARPNTGKANISKKKKTAKESQQTNHKPQTSQENKNDANRKSQTGKKVKVLIVGDSNLRNIKGEKLTNDYRDVEIRFKPGMRIEETNKKVGASTEFDVIIVHAGTNNLRDSTPKDLTETIVTTLDKVQKSNPTARVAYSSIFKRNDDQSLNAKGKKINELLGEELSIKGMDIIDNNNIMYSNLWKDGLHLNDGGVRKYSANLSKFVKYC